MSDRQSADPARLNSRWGRVASILQAARHVGGSARLRGALGQAVECEPMTNHVNQQRAYIFVRIWKDFLPDLDLSFVGGLDDDAAQQLLDRVAAGWIRDEFRDESHEVSIWARAVLAASRSAQAGVKEDAAVRVGSAYLLRAIGREPMPRAARWTLLFRESSLDRAGLLITALRAEVPIPHTVHFKAIEEGDIPVVDRLRYELELAEWDQRHVDLNEIRFPKGMTLNPLKRLRQMALKLSPLLNNLELNVRVGQHVGAPDIPTPHPATTCTTDGSSPRALPPVSSSASSSNAGTTDTSAPSTPAANESSEPVTRMRWMDVATSGTPLKGWSDIARALGRTNTRSLREEIKDWLKSYGGPIKYHRRKPFVDEGQLKAWIAEIADGASDTAGRRIHHEATVSDLEARAGADLARQGLHTKRTRRKP